MADALETVEVGNRDKADFARMIVNDFSRAEDLEETFEKYTR